MDKLEKKEQFICLNLKSFLASGEKIGSGENRLEKTLSAFSCPKNPDVEDFLHHNAIDFTKKQQSVTYLVFSAEDMDLVGYFAITMKPVVIQADEMSNATKRKLGRLSRYDEKTNGYTVAAYLIAQLGKNYSSNIKQRITGKSLMALALQELQKIQYSLGGLVVYLECEDKVALLQFYQEQNGFLRFGERITENPGETEPHRLIQLMNFL